jgi:hypothetical protein
MRKESRKPKELTLDEIEKMGIVSTRQLMENDLLMKPITRLDIQRMYNILLRICDACHEMDNRIEPWASIRKDIEGLK